MSDNNSMPCGADINPIGGAEPAIKVYSPQSPLRNPYAFIKGMLSDLVASRELAWRLFVRDLSGQYRNSLLGYLWVFIPPLMSSFPFIYLNASGVVHMGETPIPYAAYALIGTIIWQAFVDALNGPLRAMQAARSMLTRINFPREAILGSALMQIVFSVSVRFVLLLGVFALFKIVPPFTAIFFPVGILGLMLFGFMLGLLITPIGLLFGDVQQTLPIATTLLMLLTPVLYPVPETGFAAMVASVNPLTPLVVSTRDWLTIGPSAAAGAFSLVSIFSVLFLLFGWIVYRVALPHLISRLGN